MKVFVAPKRAVLRGLDNGGLRFQLGAICKLIFCNNGWFEVNVNSLRAAMIAIGNLNIYNVANGNKTNAKRKLPY